jgi:hypothetical protein
VKFGDTLPSTNIDTAIALPSVEGWKVGVHSKLTVFRVYVNLPFRVDRRIITVKNHRTMYLLSNIAIGNSHSKFCDFSELNLHFDRGCPMVFLWLSSWCSHENPPKFQDVPD